jgi:hypothetical protein
MNRNTSAGQRGLAVGSGLIVAVAAVFVILATVNIVNPMRGEESLAGMSFAELEASNPALADTVWHLNTGVNAIVIGVGALTAFLAWTGLRRGSREAWYAIAIVAVTFAVAILVAHAPVGHPGVSHWAPPLVVTAVLFLGLGISAKAILLSPRRAQPVPA